VASRLQGTLQKEEKIMREVVGKDGKVYTIFEYLEPIDKSQKEIIIREMERKEKKSREQDWKQRARYNYRKK
jgi:hypothetical protein